GHVLYRYFAIDIPRRPLPHLAAYYARLTSRPAFRQHVMVSYDELKV
ncbi:glutathione S-transferase, partial [Klebsiella pneumoniae]|nr:glutathione S-transferase [Klebsiella pneumoniae]